jgi:hypothetical protein
MKTHVGGPESAQRSPHLHNKCQDQKKDRENWSVDAAYFPSSSSVGRGRIMEGFSESKRLINDQSKDCWAERGKARSMTAPKVVRGVLSVFLKNCNDAWCLNSRLQHRVKSPSERNDEEKDKTKGCSTRIGHTDQLLVTTDDGRRNDNVRRGWMHC